MHPAEAGDRRGLDARSADRPRPPRTPRRSALASAVGHGGAGGGGGALTGRGGVGGELGGDVGLARAAAGDQRREQLPAQVGVDRQARRASPARRAGRGRRRAARSSRPGRRTALTSCSCVSRAGLGRPGEREQRGRPPATSVADRCSGATYRSSAVVSWRSSTSTTEESVSCAMLSQHQVDEVAGRRLAVAGRVPGGGPHERAGQRVVELAEVLDRGRPATARRAGSWRRRGRRR